MANYFLAIAVALSVSSASAQFNYGEAIEKSLLFYEAQRTGKLPANNRVPWRQDSFVTDSGPNGEDLSGGYFDAGDFVKFGFPFASAMSMLAWGMADFKEGYQKAGQWEYAKDALRWGMDYMIKTHPEPNVLFVQVGDGNADHSYWGRPEDWPASNPRPALRAATDKPASEVAGEYAAAMAAAAEVFFADGEDVYASNLLNHAQQLYDFAKNYPGKYSDSFPEAAQFYNSYSGFGDELLWSAAWLFRVTRDSKFQQDYETWYSHANFSNVRGRPAEASWDDKTAQAQVFLAKLDGAQKYKDHAKDFCDWVVDQAPKTPKGLVFMSQWGSLRHAGNVAFVCLQAANAGINPEKYRNFAKQQIDYMLGSQERSFLVGFGNNPPKQPHHRASSCPNRPANCDWNDYNSENANPQVLNGALVGGPDQNDKYEDKRGNYVSNEVALDYNAGFQSAVAGICGLYCPNTLENSVTTTTVPEVAISNLTTSLPENPNPTTNVPESLNSNPTTNAQENSSSTSSPTTSVSDNSSSNLNPTTDAPQNSSSAAPNTTQPTPPQQRRPPLLRAILQWFRRQFQRPQNQQQNQ